MNAIDPSLIHLLRMVQDTYAQLKELGVEIVGCSPETTARLDRLIHPAPKPQQPRKESLEDIRADIGECTRCPLSLKRTHIVFGEGHPKAVLMFVGEGPGQDEDRTGRPFVGRSGQLLTKIIEAMHLKREQVYIANVVKCRPPGNRTPLPEEIETCRPFLERQIQVIQPAFLCTLGAVATHSLLRTKEPISRMRGRFHTYRDIPLMPTFHPSYLLQNPEKKRETWEDMKKLMAAMEEAPERDRGRA